MRLFFLEHPLEIGTTGRITGSDVNHIRNVLRSKPGDRLVVFNGEGIEAEVEISTITSGYVEFMILDKKTFESESPVDITVAQAFLKERKMDALVRTLTELGIDRWVPFVSERSVSRPDPKRLTVRSERWCKIARESLKQCKRRRALEISDTLSFDDMLKACRQHTLKFIFWEEETKLFQQVLPQIDPQDVNDICIVLGPEGGFSAQEIEQAESSGFVSAGLGPRILRAETATVAAGALIQYLFGDLGQKRA